jgi:hypothetical protein
VDVYARAGQLDEAYRLVQCFEMGHARAPILYISLLAACRLHKHVRLAMKIDGILNESNASLSDDQRSAIDLLMANLYASIGDQQRSATIRQCLSRKNLQKYTGVTWTEVDGVIYEFTAHDKRHVRTPDIYRQLTHLHEQLRTHGYQPNENIDENNIERNVNEHSERLAIAWNLLCTPAGASIQLTKNLRMCIDCHHASKLIARVTQREIIVRDRSRIHCFTKDGRCSCDNHF